MSSSDDGDAEPTPPQLLAELVAVCAAPAAAAGDWDWELFKDHVAEIYRCQLQADNRAQLAQQSYESNWTVVLRRTLALLPLAADVAAIGAGGPARALALSRLLTVLRNLCTTPAFQRHLREDMVALLGAADSAAMQHCASVVRAMERALAHDTAVKETALLLKSLLQLWANMLTPGTNGAALSSADADEGLAAWRWVHSALVPRMLGSVLRLHRQQPELASICTCIVHHAVLLGCGTPDGEAPLLSRDPSSAAQTVLEELATLEVEGTRLVVHLLDAAVLAVDAQLADEDFEPANLHQEQLTVWQWEPAANKPAWMVHVLGMAFRAVPNFLEQLVPRVAEQHWLLLLRLLELWSEGLQAAHTREMEKLQQQASASEQSDNAAPSLERTAEAVPSNVAALMRWLQQQPQRPLPAPAAASAAPAADAAAAAAPSSSSPPTSSLPVDCATNAVLNCIGNILLIECWTVASGPAGAPVLEQTRARLLELRAGDTLLDLLDAADILDGGTMFSSLYGKHSAGASTSASALPAGHTRHTKPSEDPRDYVNQFSSADKAADGASPAASAAASGAAAAGSASKPAAAAPASRPTPYLFKSHLLRLVGLLSHGSPAWQDALSARAVYALMNHSVLDDHNPLMREHSVLGLRNLLEAHPANQAVVAELRTQAVANKEQLRESGIDADIDEETGKVRVATLPKQQP